MPSIPWRVISLISLASAYVSVSREREWSAWQLLSSFATTWTFQIVCWAVWAVILWPKYFSPLRDLPEPSGNSFLFGQFHRIRKEPSGIPHREWATTIPNDGLIRYLGPFNQERVLITNPKTLSEVLVTRSYDFVKPADVEHALSRILGVGLLVAEGDEHRFQRKKLMPAFAFRHVKDLYPVFWDKGREVVEAMAEHITARGLSSFSSPSEQMDPERKGKRNSAVIEVGDWASRATLDIIGVAALGKDFGAIRDPDTELGRTYRRVFSPSRQAQRLALLTLLLPNWLVARIPAKHNDDIASAAGYIRSVCRDLIREKREKMQAARSGSAGREEEKPATAAAVAAPDVDILSVALESGAFSDENLVDQLMTFLAAGHETTATAMTWAIYLLARQPDVQSRLRREVREHLPSPAAAAKVSSAEIDRLPYLNAVCSEVLRYFSPVPLTLREPVPGATIRGRRIPSGTRIVLAPWATNRDPALWGEDADEFRPERWLQGQGQGERTADDRDHQDGGADGKKHGSGGGASSNYAFLTFLHGPRSCIGQAFARAELACLLASWVGRFEFALRDEAERDERNISVKGGATAKPETGMYVHATLVDGW
ncbi:hypothetical protein DL764_007057 [Monosporascus ibericus]|uniref:Cytochrome P450 monooxygenase n=1 Tax=Monosporascus ibericus TaxID=155417 RepID=A0A4Q4T552_9PEZI|nr:hypothetical protein DL764_007057 [Monosporascus ibericus]